MGRSCISVGRSVLGTFNFQGLNQYFPYPLTGLISIQRLWVADGIMHSVDNPIHGHSGVRLVVQG